VNSNFFDDEATITHISGLAYAKTVLKELLKMDDILS
jgi:hypothetical protein